MEYKRLTAMQPSRPSSDDLTGQVFKDALVLGARSKELLFFHSNPLWLKFPEAQARAATGRPAISVRWADVNKGDGLCPNCRSRLAARQIKAQRPCW